MKILTYNIWNSDESFELRLNMLCEEIKKHNPDVLALQEVRNEKVVNLIKEATHIKYSYWKEYFDCEEGLAILSKFPIIEQKASWDNDKDIHNSGVVRTIIEYNNMKLGITNIHLDYKCVLNREIEIVKATEMIEESKNINYEILLGDFNSYTNSSIYRYLTGQQSINGHASNWIDLAERYAHLTKKEAELTIDFINNPRWQKDEVLDVPGRFDWVLIKNPYPNKYPLLKEVKLIGTETINGITPSDHYGVLCEINFN